MSFLSLFLFTIASSYCYLPENIMSNEYNMEVFSRHSYDRSLDQWTGMPGELPGLDLPSSAGLWVSAAHFISERDNKENLRRSQAISTTLESLEN